MRILHVATHLTTTGGLERLLRLHLERDFLYGFEPSVVALFQSPADVVAHPRATGLNLNRWATVHQSRRAFQKVAMSTGANIAIYHDAWGLPFLADYDSSTRRSVLLHCPSRNYLRTIADSAMLLDGLMSVDPNASNWAHTLSKPEAMPFAWLPVPIIHPAEPVEHHPLQGRLIRVGYVGRLDRVCKRADRLFSLVKRLDSSGIPISLEILGAGKLESRLHSRFKDHPRVTLHGHLAGQEYFRKLNGLDFVVNLSDVEGMGISILECMSRGVIPFYPDIHGGAECYISELGGAFLYPSGNLDHIIKSIEELTKLPPDRVSMIRDQCRKLVAKHTQDNYFSAFASFVNRIAHGGKRGITLLPGSIQPSWRHLPFALIRRLCPGVLRTPHFQNRSTPLAGKDSPPTL